MATISLIVSEHVWMFDAYKISTNSSSRRFSRNSKPIMVEQGARPIADIDIPLIDYYGTSFYFGYLAEKVSVSDKESMRIQKYIEEILRIIDTYMDAVSFRRHATERLYIIDAKPVISFDWRPIIRETLAMRDSIRSNIWITKKERMEIDDAFQHAWKAYLAFFESIHTEEKSFRVFVKKEAEVVRVLDTENKSFQKNIDELWQTKDEFRRKTAIKRVIQELISIGEELKKRYDIYAAEHVDIFSAYVRASNAIIEAIQISNKALDVATFQQIMNKPPTCEEFTDFNVGDYEYEKALMRLQIISNATHSQPLLYDVAAHVDIDDTNDKGQVQITDTTAAIKVYFNKFYYNAPEVQATINGGTGDAIIIPFILTTDGKDEKGRYFEIEIRDTAGNRTIGTVSWAAKGW